MKKKYTYINTVYYSFFSRDLYRVVARKWEGTGFLYIAFALFFMLLLPVVTSTIQLRSIVADRANISQHKDVGLFGTALTLEPVIQFIEQFPTLILEGGRARADVAQPYYIYIGVLAEKGDQKPFMIIDTTGQTKEAPANGAILITDQFVLTKLEDGSESRQDLSRVKNAVVDKDVLYRWLSWQPVIYFPGIYVVHFIAYCLNSLVFGLMGLGLSRYMKIDLDYKDNIRLAAITSTPVMLLEVLSALINMQLFAKPSLIYLFAHAAYMYHAVESNKKKPRD